MEDKSSMCSVNNRCSGGIEGAGVLNAAMEDKSSMCSVNNRRVVVALRVLEFSMQQWRTRVLCVV